MKNKWINRLYSSVPSGVDLEARTIKGLASAEVPDSHGTLILASAFQNLDRYLKNPVVALNHKTYEIPPGKCIALNRVSGGLETCFQMDVSEDGEEILQAAGRDMIRGFSVGGWIEDYVCCYDPEEDWADLPGFAQGLLKTKAVFAVVTKFNLAEISICTIPSCPDALIYRKADQPEEFNFHHAAIESIARALQSIEARLGVLAAPAAQPVAVARKIDSESASQAIFKALKSLEI